MIVGSLPPGLSGRTGRAGAVSAGCSDGIGLHAPHSVLAGNASLRYPSKTSPVLLAQRPAVVTDDRDQSMPRATNAYGHSVPNQSCKSTVPRRNGRVTAALRRSVLLWDSQQDQRHGEARKAQRPREGKVTSQCDQAPAGVQTAVLSRLATG